MSSRSFVPGFLAVAFLLTTAGVASARRPPALAHLQEQSAGVLSTCPAGAAEGSGYRDIMVRLPSESAKEIAKSAPRLVAHRKMVNHLMVRCAGGEIHESGGYRDVFFRLFQESTEPQIARAGRLIPSP